MLSTFFNIIHWKELLYFIFLLFLFKFCFLYGYGFKTTLSFFDLSLLALSSVFIIASGYLTNYFKRKQGIKNVFPLQEIKVAIIVFAFLGFFLGVLLSFKINKPSYSFIFLFCLIATILYAINTKKKTFIDSIGKSFLKPFIILVVLWFDAPISLTPSQWDLFFKLQAIAIVYIIISFLGNIVREIVIDINKINNDYSRKNSTLPVLLGRKRAKNIALVLSILVSFIVIYFSITFLKSKYLLLSVLLLVTLPELIFIYYLIQASTQKNFKFLYKISNIAYLLGILSVPIVTYYFKYVIK